MRSPHLSLHLLPHSLLLNPPLLNYPFLQLVLLLVVSYSPSISTSGLASSFSQSPTQVMANQPAQPWTNLGAVLVANPNALPANPEKWLPSVILMMVSLLKNI